jgi:hypothetical protein
MCVSEKLAFEENGYYNNLKNIVQPYPLAVNNKIEGQGAEIICF